MSLSVVPHFSLRGFVYVAASVHDRCRPLQSLGQGAKHFRKRGGLQNSREASTDLCERKKHAPLFLACLNRLDDFRDRNPKRSNTPMLNAPNIVVSPKVVLALEPCRSTSERPKRTNALGRIDHRGVTNAVKLRWRATRRVLPIINLYLFCARLRKLYIDDVVRRHGNEGLLKAGAALQSLVGVLLPWDWEGRWY